MKRKKLKIFIYSLGSLFLFLILFLCVLYLQISRDASTRIERGVIDRIIFSESPVYYDDGETPIGVFFEKTHRKYIHYPNIPKTFVKAIIAAEDRNFFNHSGFDMKAMTRAMIANIKARKVVQGGSTITQQTAKNIFKRQRRSYMSKLKELIQARLLESQYSKEEILEMYINQFFVTGFGRGLRIAAQYFFDKEAEDLDLVESAFIAGSVKGPFRYNPFTKKTEAEKEKARQLAKLRKNYVLSAMRKMNFITQEQYLGAKEDEVPFKEGKVTYRLNVILNYIREQLESDYFRAILQEQGVENIATSGVRIYTSINREIQEGALRGIRRHLPLLDVQLSGYSTRPAREEYVDSAKERLPKGKTDLPFLCRITHIKSDKENPSLVVAWEKGGGIIDYEGLKPTGQAWLKWKLGSGEPFDRGRVAQFMKNFKVGDLVAVQRTETRKGNGQMRLVLSKFPELEGGIIVLKEGMIKAMVGGFFDRYFNRAVDAKRQLGSIFKPLIYTAAFQLKWNSLDPLINRRDLFRFENTFYLPKPDHEPESHKVSITWAGVKSENLATVWLLYHLTDRLNMSEFRHVVELVGLGRKGDEAYEDYVIRIRDKHGVVVNREALMEAAFQEAKKEIESDLIFIGHEDALENVHRLHFTVDTAKLNLKDPHESQINSLSFQRLRTLNFEMKRRFKRVQDLLGLYKKDEKQTWIEEELRKTLRSFYFAETEEAGLRVIYADPMGEMGLAELTPVTPEWIFDRPEPLPVEGIWINGLIPSEGVDLLQLQLQESYKKLVSQNRYDLAVLSKVRDFRTLVNLMYVTHLSKEMGISTRLDPVLSFPLGANSISIIESALAYHTIMTGLLYPVSDGLKPGSVPVITKIVDREAETIWEYRPQPKRILTSRVSGLVSEILHQVIENGTGQRAKDAIRLSVEIDNEELDIPIPSFGKTGTADRFTNSSFVGFIPGLQKDPNQLDNQKGYVIASYVGYDDNRPMKGKNVTIYGASGALPLWIETANTIINSNTFKKDIQAADLAFDIQSVPFRINDELNPVLISSTTGLPSREQDPEIMESNLRILSDVDTKEGIISLKRVFEPISGADYEEVPEI
ncbi:MAG: transglycosylase domain-containing protein [Desulfobacteraceae bacterium]|jgi:membrane peptidoglycan carboxypeptidase